MKVRIIKYIALGCALLFSSIAFANLPDFSKFAEELSPAVVNISTTRTVKANGPGMPRIGGPDEFNEMIERFFGPQGFEGPEYNAQSLGSGFIISPDGYIITNNHVVSGAETMVVGLVHGAEYTAKLVGADPTSDLALLKIDVEHALPTLTFGSSEKLKVGEWVFAIGSPFGFDYSVTQGIVSAKGRGLDTEKYVPFIQTDVAINPGSSGGPLFNMDGEVIGVNSQIISRTGGYLGLSFAIPSDLVQDVVRQLKANGKVQRGWLGVSFQQMSKDLAESFGLKHPQGALVSEVMEGSPAAKAGLKPGDVILSFNKRVIESASELPPLVGFTAPGTEIELGLIRNKSAKTITVAVGELPTPPTEPHEPTTSVKANLLGIEVKDLSSEEKQHLNLSNAGVMVTRIGRNSIALRAGLRPGDILINLNQVPLKSKADFDHVVAEVKPDEIVSILMARQGVGQRYLALKVPKKADAKSHDE